MDSGETAPSDSSPDAPAGRGTSRLPATAVAALRAAFADELAERLPRLREAARTLEPSLVDQALRDVHTLGSSAYVVGEDEAARVARAAEAALVSGADAGTFVRLVAELDGLLGGWRA